VTPLDSTRETTRDPIAFNAFIVPGKALLLKETPAKKSYRAIEICVENYC
jgi:hypothetical protein